MAASRGSPVVQARCGRIRVRFISETIRRDAISRCLGARVSAAVGGQMVRWWCWKMKAILLRTQGDGQAI